VVGAVAPVDGEPGALRRMGGGLAGGGLAAEAGWGLDVESDMEMSEARVELKKECELGV
jgi:hypothetical protein